MESVWMRHTLSFYRNGLWRREILSVCTVKKARTYTIIHHEQKQKKHWCKRLILGNSTLGIQTQLLYTAAAAIDSSGTPFPLKMASWQIHSYGGLEELQLTHAAKIPPITNPTDVLVEIRATSVNPIDVFMLEGYGSAVINLMRQMNTGFAYSMEFPLVLGRDFSGIVVECGHQVKDFRVGDEVWGVLGVQRQGSHAHYAVAAADSLSKKPSTLTHSDAASIPYVALTTWSALRITGELSEQSAQKAKVLVRGGSGGIGTFAIQLLKTWGAQVTSTCSRDAVPLLESLGADIVIDYAQLDAEEKLKAHEGFDIILDVSGQPDMKYVNFLRPWKCSKYITLSSPSLQNIDQYGLFWGMMKNVQDLMLPNVYSSIHGTSYRWAYFMPSGLALKKVAKLMEQGQIMPVVERVFPFADAQEAYRKVQAGHARGKVVISVVENSENEHSDPK